MLNLITSRAHAATGDVCSVITIAVSVRSYPQQRRTEYALALPRCSHNRALLLPATTVPHHRLSPSSHLHPLINGMPQSDTPLPKACKRKLAYAHPSSNLIHVQCRTFFSFSSPGRGEPSPTQNPPCCEQQDTAAANSTSIVGADDVDPKNTDVEYSPTDANAVAIGSAVGAKVGSVVGAKVGSSVGCVVGSAAGSKVGPAVSNAVCGSDPLGMSSALGSAIGSAIGWKAGSVAGVAAGAVVGSKVGSVTGARMGLAVDTAAGSVRSTVGSFGSTARTTIGSVGSAVRNAGCTETVAKSVETVTQSVAATTGLDVKRAATTTASVTATNNNGKTSSTRTGDWSWQQWRKSGGVGLGHGETEAGGKASPAYNYPSEAGGQKQQNNFWPSRSSTSADDSTSKTFFGQKITSNFLPSSLSSYSIFRCCSSNDKSRSDYYSPWNTGGFWVQYPLLAVLAIAVVIPGFFIFAYYFGGPREWFLVTVLLGGLRVGLLVALPVLLVYALFPLYEDMFEKREDN